VKADEIRIRAIAAKDLNASLTFAAAQETPGKTRSSGSSEDLCPAATSQRHPASTDAYSSA